LVQGIREKKGLKLGHVNDATRKDDLTRFIADKLSTLKDEKQAKTRKKIDENKII